MDDMSYTTKKYSSNPSEQENVELLNSNDVDVDVDGDIDDDDHEENGVQKKCKDEYQDEENGVQKKCKDEYQDDNGNNSDFGSTHKYPKKRKLESMLSSYEFAPRIPVPEASGSARIGTRSSFADWSEHETFILLGAWGDKYLQRGHKNLRSEEWQEVAETVSQESLSDKTDCQCRNRLDTLKKKYKKEKAKTISNWVYFQRMDSLLSSSSPETGLSSALEEEEEEDEDSQGLPPKRTKIRKDSFKSLANCIEKFSTIYKKIEYRKQQQMVELEKMRMDYLRDLDLQKRQILEKARAEIAKIHQGDDEENDVSC